MRALSLGIVLFGFWLLLSGHYTPFLIGMGAASAALCVWMAQRMGLIDVEGHPVQLALGAVTFFPWLLVEIFKSSFSVAVLVLRGPSAIAPNLIKVRAGQSSQVGINVYGNAITLTPGTITVDVDGDEFTVHALTHETAADLESGTMDRRVQRMERGL
ncbi:MAG: Na+/H+ antiporter subunit E [Pseudomonadota bacterium]